MPSRDVIPVFGGARGRRASGAAAPPESGLMMRHISKIEAAQRSRIGGDGRNCASGFVCV